MVHTLPDYTTKYKMATIFGQIDTGELAARLGSIDTFDRRGNVVWMDDFEGPILKWDVIAVGTGAAVVLDTTYVKNGSQSVKLTTGDAVGNYAEISRSLSLPVETRLGLEASFTSTDHLSYYYFSLAIYDGSLEHIARITYKPPTDILEARDSPTTSKTIASALKLYPLEGLFNTIKFVIDYSTKKYVRCILNEVEYPIPTVTYATATNYTTPYAKLIIHIVTGYNSNQSMYLDNVIFTQNEP